MKLQTERFFSRTTPVLLLMITSKANKWFLKRRNSCRPLSPMKSNFDMVPCLYLFLTIRFFFFQETCCHYNLCNANMEENAAFHGYFKNGSVIHNINVLIIVVMVCIVSVITDHRFSSWHSIIYFIKPLLCR